MKPQKKAIVAQKAPKSPPVAKKRKAGAAAAAAAAAGLSEKLSVDPKKDKKGKKADKTKKLLDSERKKLNSKSEPRRKFDDKKKSNRDIEEADMDENKKLDKISDKIEESSLDVVASGSAVEKKKGAKSDDKVKIDKQLVENKKKIEKGEDKKKVCKEDALENDPSPTSVEEISGRSSDEKSDIQSLTGQKKKVATEKKKDGKPVKSESKENLKNPSTKDKKIDLKKLSDKDPVKKSKTLASSKKETNSKNNNNNKKSSSPSTVKKTSAAAAVVLAKKSTTPLVKKLIDKKLKLVKSLKDESSTIPDEESESTIKTKKKTAGIVKNKSSPNSKPKLAKQMKAKPKKNGKISTVLKKENLKKITDKIVNNKKKLEIKDTTVDKASGDVKKLVEEEPLKSDEIKKEIPQDEDNLQSKVSEAQQTRKSTKNSLKPRTPRKPMKKSLKPTMKGQEEDEKQLPNLDDNLSVKSPKSLRGEESVKSPAKNRDSENSMSIDMKIESPTNGDSSESSKTSTDAEDSDYMESRSNRCKRQSDMASDDEERTRRMRLFGFWSGPKRHRVASLNALAKVHCLYENEAGGVYLGGFCKPKPEKDKPRKTAKEADKEESSRKEKETSKKCEDGGSKAETASNISKRNLRNVPGLRGKHWDMMESSSSSSSSSASEDESERNVKRGRKKNTTRKKKPEEVMDLKDMVVCKRMASLNASAILAASYSDEKNRQTSSSSDETSDSEVEIIKRRRHQGESEADKRKARQEEEALKASKKVVIVNQDTDVTITGVYVNQTRSTHHEGFCSIAGMQYRISSTSHTQTAATAVAAELHEQQQKAEHPCKSYTPLGALSSMQPPGSQAGHPNLSPRRHSAFSAPHQHGYYQPAGPLIQHPPTLPPIKAPPPEPTPTPPQNSEGSDDLVATSTTSGGTNSTAGGGFYRAYCPQYYSTPPQYQELCYPPTYPHPHQHPPPYYKYAPAYRRQYYGYPEAGGGAGAGGAGTGAPGVVEYQPPPGEYPMPPYYTGYPPPPPPPPPNPAYLHAQGRPIVDHAAFQGCPCPMQSCPKNADTGPLIGNGKGAPVASGPGLSLPPSALVGPPSPARGLAGLAPPHGANAWDTDRVQLNTHRNLNQNQIPTSATHNLVAEHRRTQSSECRTKDKKACTSEKLSKCACQKRACTSTCEVKQETLSPTEATIPSPSETLPDFPKLENNNVKCESCSVGIGGDNLACVANCNVKSETDFKCDLIKCEQCMKEGQMAILEIDKDSGILLIDDKLEAEGGVKEELNDVVVVDGHENWTKPDYEPTVTEADHDDIEGRTIIIDEIPKCQKLTKRKLSLDSLSNSPKKRKVNKRTLSVGSTRENHELEDTQQQDRVPNPMNGEYLEINNKNCESLSKKKPVKKDSQKRKAEDSAENLAKKAKNVKQASSNGLSNCLSKHSTDHTSYMETINNVIQQSVQMTSTKDAKCRGRADHLKGDKKKKTMNLLSMMKKVPKTLAKTVVSEKMCLSKTNNREVKNKLIKSQDSRCPSNKVKAKFAEVKSKVDWKVRAVESKTRDITKKFETVLRTTKTGDERCEDIKRSEKKKRKSTKKTCKKPSSKAAEDSSVVSENCTGLTKKSLLKPKWSNGWSWEGDSYEAKVYLTNEESAIRRCYSSMRHSGGDVLRPRDCVLLKSGTRKADLPFVAKIAALWENPDDGEMMFSLLWYYRPEHTEQGRTEYDTEDEVFASRHRDANSVACIEDKCYILTFNEYCRYRKDLRRMDEGLDSPGLIVPPGEQNYPRASRQPPIPVSADRVLFCRRVYDYRGKKLVKNPG